MSDTFQLSERECEKWLKLGNQRVRASLKQNQKIFIILIWKFQYQAHGFENPLDMAIFFFLKERIELLKALLTLIKVWCKNIFPLFD
jgi:hypothetical protein